MVRFSSILTLVNLSMCIFLFTKSSAESYKDNEKINSYDEFLSENSLYESYGDDRYNQDLYSKSHEEEEVYSEEESKPYDGIRPDKDIYELDEYDWNYQDLPSKLYREEETDEKRGFLRSGKLNSMIHIFFKKE